MYTYSNAIHTESQFMILRNVRFCVDQYGWKLEMSHVKSGEF
jgi:hypothetical protein